MAQRPSAMLDSSADDDDMLLFEPPTEATASPSSNRHHPDSGDGCGATGEAAGMRPPEPLSPEEPELLPPKEERREDDDDDATAEAGSGLSDAASKTVTLARRMKTHVFGCAGHEYVAARLKSDDSNAAPSPKDQNAGARRASRKRSHATAWAPAEPPADDTPFFGPVDVATLIDDVRAALSDAFGFDQAQLRATRRADTERRALASAHAEVVQATCAVPSLPSDRREYRVAMRQTLPTASVLSTSRLNMHMALSAAVFVQTCSDAESERVYDWMRLYDTPTACLDAHLGQPNAVYAAACHSAALLANVVAWTTVASTQAHTRSALSGAALTHWKRVHVVETKTVLTLLEYANYHSFLFPEHARTGREWKRAMFISHRDPDGTLRHFDNRKFRFPESISALTHVRPELPPDGFFLEMLPQKHRESYDALSAMRACYVASWTYAIEALLAPMITRADRMMDAVEERCKASQRRAAFIDRLAKMMVMDSIKRAVDIVRSVRSWTTVKQRAQLAAIVNDDACDKRLFLMPVSLATMLATVMDACASDGCVASFETKERVQDPTFRFLCTEARRACQSLETSVTSCDTLDPTEREPVVIEASLVARLCAIVGGRLLWRAYDGALQASAEAGGRRDALCDFARRFEYVYFATVQRTTHSDQGPVDFCARVLNAIQQGIHPHWCTFRCKQSRRCADAAAACGLRGANQTVEARDSTWTNRVVKDGPVKLAQLGPATRLIGKAMAQIWMTKIRDELVHRVDHTVVGMGDDVSDVAARSAERAGKFCFGDVATGWIGVGLADRFRRLPLLRYSSEQAWRSGAGLSPSLGVLL